MPVSFRKNLAFKPKPESRLDEFEFIGGLVTDVHETKLKPEQSPNLKNITFNQTGSIKKRSGYTRYGTGQDAQGSGSDQTNFGASTGSLALDDASEYFAQTFQASGAISCLQVDLSLAMNTAGQTQKCRVELWTTSAGAPSAIINSLAKSQVKTISGTSETTYQFRFSTPVALSAATTYAIVLKPFVQGSSTTVYRINTHHTGAAYANGNVYTTTTAGASWASDTAKDLKFTVYGGGNTGGTGLIRYYGPSGIKQTIVKYGTTLYRGNDSTGALTAITLGSGDTLTAANFIDWVVVNGTLLVTDGESYIQKYRGSTNANYSTGTITATNGSAAIVGAGTSWATSTNAEVGEYIKLPDGKWYKITVITDNTNLTVEAVYYGTTLATQSYTISPWGEIQGRFYNTTSLVSEAVSTLSRPTPKFIESHAFRTWTANEPDSVNRVRWSIIDGTVAGVESFNDWDTLNNGGALILPSGKGDQITGMYSLNGVLYVFQRHATWKLLGTSPNNFEFKNVSNEVGLIDKRTLVEYDNYLVFLSDLGVYIFDGVNFKNLTDGVINATIATFANKTTPTAILWDNSYLLSYTPSGGSYNSEALVIDLTREVWGRMTNLYVGDWSVWNGSTDVGEVYFVSSNQGTIYRWDVGTNDDGYEIPMLYDTPSLGFDKSTNTKTLKKFFVQAAASGDYNLTITMYKDLSSTGDDSTVDLSGGAASLWGTMVWGDNWSGEGTLITERIGEFQGDAKFMKFRFEQGGLDEPTEIFGITSTQRIRRLT